MSAQHSWEAMPEAFRVRIRGTVAAADITAALSNIERQVRAQLSEELQQIASDRSYDSHEDVTEAYLTAARIVRGDHS